MKKTTAKTTGRKAPAKRAIKEPVGSEMKEVSSVELKLSSQYVFVSDQGKQLSDGVTLELKAAGHSNVTVIRTDTKHTTVVVKELQDDGDKVVINVDDFGESKTLLFTANAATPDGFALTACASVFKIDLSGLPTTEETDHEAQAAVVDQFYESLQPKETLPAMADFDDDSFIAEQLEQFDDDCEDCEIAPEDKVTEILCPVPQAQLHDWAEITDEDSRVYVWEPGLELRIDEPRAIFWRKDQIGWAVVIVDSSNTAYDIAPGWRFVVRHRRTS